MKDKLAVTHRGFSILVFKDLYGKQLSLQKSRLATADAVWLGVDAGECGYRMHLTQNQVATLLPYLKKFVKSGELD